MKHFVLDASVALSWFIDHPVAPYASHVRQLLLAGDRGIVPVLWYLEVVNGFLVAERRGNLTPTDTAQALLGLEIVLAQAIEPSQEPVSLRRTMTVARQSKLTAYDALYLDIAKELQLPLATLDQQLAKAATSAGVQIVR